MKKTIQTTISLVAIIALMSFTKQATSLKGTEKHYTYCYAVDNDNKVLYVSDVLSCYFSDVSYKKTTITNKNAAKSSLVVRWDKKVAANGCKYCTNDHVEYWDSSFNSVDEARDEIIADYRNDNFRIKYITSFYFECND